MEHLEIEFLIGDYFDKPLPSDKWYLLRYFDGGGEIQLHFLKYYTRFKSIRMFVDHTGFYCTGRYLYILQRKYKFLESRMEKAKFNFDLTKVFEIEAGKLKVYRDWKKEKR